MARLADAGLHVFDEAPTSLTAFRTGVAQFFDDAVRTRSSLTKLAPVKRVSWAVKNRAANIERAEGALKRMGLDTDFDLLDDVQEIQQKMTNVYLAGAIGSADNVHPVSWQRGMPDQGAREYGQVWARKLIEMVEDPLGKKALRRYAAHLAGDTPDGTLDVAAVVSHPRWQIMKHDLQLRYPGLDDMQLADRYMDDLLRQEIENLFAPLLVGKTPADKAKLIEDYVRTRKIETTLDGLPVNLNLTSRNVGGGSRQAGEVMVTLKNTALPMPREIPAPSFDPRFMSNDGNALSKLGDMVLRTFGEGATQVLNRRPAWVGEYKRWLANYRKIGVPDEVAVRLAQEHASEMVNYVYYNIDEAPFLVEKMNRAVPFFGATYEVLSTWTYKMPVAVGGSWPLGAGEFGRKFRRLMDAFVNLGIITRVEEDDGSVSHVLHLTPPEDSLSQNEIGTFLKGAGFKAVNTFESTIASILSMEDGLGLREGGYRLAVGDPLDFTDYGVLSFAQAQIGLNPFSNWAVTQMAAQIPGAADSERTAVAAGESLTDVADRMDVDAYDLARLNRGAFFDQLDEETYLRLMAGQITPDEIRFPEGLPLEVPDTDLWSNVIQDIFQPFGAIEDGKDLMTSRCQPVANVLASFRSLHVRVVPQAAHLW
jgi:hypothetical protein